jgi:hypothetical protein
MQESSVSLFNYINYKDFLNSQIASNSDFKGYRTKLAEAAGCQKTYLSQVIKTNVHLTPEHGIGLAAYWRFDSLETNYWLNLIHWGRTSHFKLKRMIEEQLNSLKNERENLSKRFSEKPLEDYESQSIYYSSPVYGIVHMLVGVDSFQTPASISKRLNLPLEFTREILKELQQMGLVTFEKNLFIPTSKNIHLPKDSPLNYINHQNWRNRAMLDIQAKLSDGVHYSSVHTMTTKDFLKVKDILIEIIEAQRSFIKSSLKEEEVVCFTCDWFKI